ncbi:MFS transporter [Clostridium sp. 'deep sea']|uniref:MFS transporter n=1 Tax=Clostridium sp. 'deep sea' TaxID=2779445 RepID=UPI0018965F9D|nr:MFS transporter [Clostridium sp. 'deep sea']QOR34726.1 MFS transporter [Clostridium sp. 'deep sea']
MNLKDIKGKNPILLLLGQLVSTLGSSMQLFALSLYVLDTTQSATMFSNVILLSMIPRIVLGPFAGVLADRVSRKKLIVILDAIAGFLTFLFVALLYCNNGLSLTQIYIFTLLLGMITVLFEPATAAIIPDIVEKEQLATINSVRRLILSFTTILAPLLGGILYSQLGLLIVMVLNGISFFLSSISEMFISVHKESVHKAKKNHFLNLLLRALVF